MKPYPGVNSILVVEDTAIHLGARVQHLCRNACGNSMGAGRGQVGKNWGVRT
ncbi:hypothetical protein VP01_773g13 [Puccinia sorghi]|uniref:Uncharacterized protein n=1 Tax=Puccinia sorghi TaxID=27349 RepID=A0A0L6UCA7_9BASI|nr:hypothetical protein VP01_773g13 [Puccinia sorghi]